MHIGEIAALVIVCLLLFGGCVFFTYRCCGSMVEMNRDANQPEKSFTRNLRTSIRRSFRRMSGRSRSRPRGQAQSLGQGPVVQVSTVDDLVRERSELHPHYTKHHEPPPTYDEAMSHPGAAKQNVPGSASKPRYVHPQYNTDCNDVLYGWSSPSAEPQVAVPVHSQWTPQSRYSPVQEKPPYHEPNVPRYSPNQPSAPMEDTRAHYSPREPVTLQYSSPHQQMRLNDDPRSQYSPYRLDPQLEDLRSQYSPRHHYEDEDPSALYAVPHKLRKQHQQQSQSVLPQHATAPRPAQADYDHAPHDWSGRHGHDNYKSYEHAPDHPGYGGDDGGFGAMKGMTRSPGYREGLSIMTSRDAPSDKDRSGLNYASAYSNQAYNDDAYPEPMGRHIDPDYANHREFYKQPEHTNRRIDHEDVYHYQEEGNPPYYHGNDSASVYDQRSPSGYRTERQARVNDARSPTTYRNDGDVSRLSSGHRSTKEAPEGYPRMHYRPDTGTVHLGAQSYGLQGDTYI